MKYYRSILEGDITRLVACDESKSNLPAVVVMIAESSVSVHTAEFSFKEPDEENIREKVFFNALDKASAKFTSILTDSKTIKARSRVLSEAMALRWIETLKSLLPEPTTMPNIDVPNGLS